jgi:hypothetical protein
MSWQGAICYCICTAPENYDVRDRENQKKNGAENSKKIMECFIYTT